MAKEDEDVLQPMVRAADFQVFDHGGGFVNHKAGVGNEEMRNAAGVPSRAG
ncbi:hypothetical protein [Verrucomicrobium spinosum]|uniref:hypothetical protein n=1 Tax=Verrucomicrobium spinosum TaxID=2736 RepID=UPI001C446183|nr:hypothetical protein [Verrucomicrobium spinosum]